jgi:hypothetical protein
MFQFQIESNTQGGGCSGLDLNHEFFLFPNESADSSGSETSKESPKNESEKSKSSTEEQSPISKKPKVSKRKSAMTPFGETDKSDSDTFYVDIIYAVLHMIGEI